MAVLEALQAIPGVEDVHDLHIWSISSQATSLTCHIMVCSDVVLLASVADILHRRRILRKHSQRHIQFVPAWVFITPLFKYRTLLTPLFAVRTLRVSACSLLLLDSIL